MSIRVAQQNIFVLDPFELMPNGLFGLDRCTFQPSKIILRGCPSCFLIFHINFIGRYSFYHGNSIFRSNNIINVQKCIK